ncbi:EthD family reductase [Noviherbaspirillum pedocola]|uniref:EthD family reductase n=1 Tax=Noviherbaspirillum pedocola TaxID=2801341 RepID=A0A934W1R2_9BURK|nr:EthD family reductase [Noviherbaspirillum pedocola]MBK4735476.1 EthD family reductase [Noviherbaspirillum pedocola]
MAKLIVLYKQPQDEAAFMRHYFDVHAPLAKRIPGLRSYEVSEGGVAAPGGASGVFLVAMLEFDSMAALQEGMGSSQGQAAVNDLPNFAGAGVDILMCDTRKL